mmetsp:Transcript_21051/g.54498  ORF Transcript_21051/g.54498 Transcript_21051/m.54498 type:complete len:80 (+) Transcript_21051:4979-5218(+)
MYFFWKEMVSLGKEEREKNGPSSLLYSSFLGEKKGKVEEKEKKGEIHVFSSSEMVWVAQKACAWVLCASVRPMSDSHPK